MPHVKETGPQADALLFYTRDAYLFRKIQLELAGVRKLSMRTAPRLPDGRGSGIFALYDLDSFREDAPDRADVLFLSRDPSQGEKHRAFLALPLRIGAIRARFSQDLFDTPRLSLSDADRTVSLDGKRIRLSELEFSLLSVLCVHGGETVPRERIAQRVFPKGASAGMLNVYIHYLREKLENGEKVILSSRGGGYRINPRFLAARSETTCQKMQQEDEQGC